MGLAQDDPRSALWAPRWHGAPRRSRARFLSHACSGRVTPSDASRARNRHGRRPRAGGVARACTGRGSACLPAAGGRTGSGAPSAARPCLPPPRIPPGPGRRSMPRRALPARRNLSARRLRSVHPRAREPPRRPGPRRHRADLAGAHREDRRPRRRGRSQVEEGLPRRRHEQGRLRGRHLRRRAQHALPAHGRRGRASASARSSRIATSVSATQPTLS
jgi:hypothetical protein